MDYVSDNALVESVDSQRYLVASTTPLRAKNAQGDEAPVSLDLLPHGTGYAPRNSAVDLQMAADGSGAMTVSGGITVTPSGSSPEDASLVGNRLVYANSASDADYMLEPLPTGAEAFWQLRSERSPENLSLHFDLPDGAVLRESAELPGSAEVVEDGRVVLTVQPPATADADGESVPTTLTVDGDSITVHVDLSGDINFPVLVDPVLYDDTLSAFYGSTGAANLWPGWTFAQSGGFGSDMYAGLLQTLDDPATTGHAVSGYAYWIVHQHGTAKINRVDLQGAEHQQAGTTSFFSELQDTNNAVTGAWTTDGYRNPAASPEPNGGVFMSSAGFSGLSVAHCAETAGGLDNGPGQPLCTAAGGAGSFLFGLAFPATNPQPPTVTNYSRIYGATIRFHDSDNPSAILSLSNSWGPSVSGLSLHGTDAGVGVTAFNVNVGGHALSQNEGDCASAANGWFCSGDDTKTFSDPAAPEGAYAVSGAVTDAVGHQGTAPAVMAHVDRTAPLAPSVSGLRRAFGSGSWPLAVNAPDSFAHAQTVSGTRTASVKVDGTIQASFSPGCSQNCAASGTYNLDGRQPQPAPETPPVAVSDDFTGASGTDLAAHSTPTGGGWVSRTAMSSSPGSLTLTGSGAASRAWNATTSAYYTNSIAAQNMAYTVSATVSFPSSMTTNDYAGLVGQFVSATNTGYDLAFVKQSGSSGQWQLNRHQQTGRTPITTASAYSVLGTNGTLSMKFDASGTVIATYRGQQILTANIPASDVVAPGLAGLMAGNLSNARGSQVLLDDFRVQADAPAPGPETTGRFAEGSHTLQASSIDAAGNLAPTFSSPFILDRTNPVSSADGTLRQTSGWLTEGTYDLTVSGHDDHQHASAVAGLKTLDAFADTVSDLHALHKTPDPAQDSTVSDTYHFPVTDYADGTHTIHVQGSDDAGNSAAEITFPVQVDHTKPTLTVTGGLRQGPVASGRSLSAKAVDATSGVDTVQVFMKPAASLTPDSAAPLPAELVAGRTCSQNCTDPAGTTVDYTLDTTTLVGRYQFTVQAYDKAGLLSEDRWIVNVVQLGSVDRSKLGLEQHFDLDDTDPGSDQTLYVNGETGNLVWHASPIEEAGRGLSSQVSLNYNSGERGGLLAADLGRVPVIGQLGGDDAVLGNDLAGVAYREAGVGVSVGVNGPTRVNDPLSGVLPARAIEVTQTDESSSWPDGAPTLKISLTDADGTEHTFSRGAGQDHWVAPPELNLRLSYIGPRQGAALGSLTGAMLNQPKPAVCSPGPMCSWQLQRSDGVKYIFDQFGYLQQTVDRNGNVLDYHYKAVSALTGQDCASTDPVGKLLASTQAAVGLCIEQLQEVRQPGWSADTNSPDNNRKIAFTYTQGSPLSVDLLSSLGLAADSTQGLMYALGKGPQIETITDSSGRVDKLEYYDSSDPHAGYLHFLRENVNATGDQASGDVERVTRFDYDEPSATSPPTTQPGDVDQLTGVVPIAVGAGGAETAQPGTTITYEPRTVQADLRPPALRRITKIVKRNGAAKLYRYTAPADGNPRSVMVIEQVTGTRYLARYDLLDGAGRPTSVRQGQVNLASETASAQPVGASTTTTLSWDLAENKPATVTDATGTQDERTTTYTYASGHLGVLSAKSVSKGSDSKTTTFSYYEDRLPNFVADLQTIVEPGGRTWQYTVDANGNTTFTKDPDQTVTETRYGTNGVVLKQQDQMGRWIDFGDAADHDPSGAPKTVTLPADANVPARVWRYRYDTRGDLTQVIDPRNTSVGSSFGASDPFVTSLAHDPYGRLIREQIPRDSASDDAHRDGSAYTVHSRQYDTDGDPTSMTTSDGTTQIVYDAMGDAVAVKQPAQDGLDVTDYVYDNASRMIATARPRGAWGDDGTLPATIRDEQLDACESPVGDQGSHPFVTRYCLDYAGRPVAQTDYAPADRLVRRISTFAYDRRGNLIRQNDPNHNSTVSAGETDPVKKVTTQQPLTIAGAISEINDTASTPRASMTYDLLDRQVTQVEHPTESDQNDRTQTTTYDDAGDVQKVTQSAPGQADRVTQMAYDPAGRMLSQTDPEGHLTCYKRQADGLVTAMTSPRGTAENEGDCPDPAKSYEAFTTTFTYDNVGELSSRSVPYSTDEYGPDRTDVKSWKVSYTRDAVGNPIGITDARGNAITNTFFDSGDLRSTTRPSFWAVDQPGDQANPDPGQHYTAGTPADVDLPLDGPQITEAGAAGSSDSQQPDFSPSPDTNADGTTDFGSPDRENLPSLLPQAGLTTFSYDPEMRLSAVKDADGHPRTIGYDPKGQIVKKTWPMDASNTIEHDYGYDPDGNLTSVTTNPNIGTDATPDASQKRVVTFAPDGYDQRVSQTTPGASDTGYGDPPAAQTTGFDYDADGNLITRTTARGGAFSYRYDSLDDLTYEANPAGEIWSYDYDGFGDLAHSFAPQPAGLNSDLYKTSFTYDRDARLLTATSLVDQPGGGDPHTLSTTYGYDADGNQNSTVAPGPAGDVTTSVDYDGRDLPWRTTVSGGTGDLANSRTSISEYDANGNLRRSVNPAGIDSSTHLPSSSDDGGNSTANVSSAAQDATLYARNSDDQVTAEYLPWHGSDDKHYVRNWVRDADLSKQGWVSAVEFPHEVGTAALWRTNFDRNQAGWVTGRTDADHDTSNDSRKAQITYGYDHDGEQTSWHSIHAKVDDRGRDIQWEYWGDGQVKRRSAVKLVDDGSGSSSEDVTTKRSYDYLYNLNRSLVRVVDQQAGDSQEQPLAKTMVFARDDAERQTRVTSTGAADDVLMSYQPGTGLLANRQTDGTANSDGSYTGGNSTDFTYDSQGRELSATANGGQRVTHTTWFDGGQMHDRTKSDGTIDRWSWDGIGQLHQHDRIKTGDSSDPSPTIYSYDLNGDRTSDERGTEAYNARGQLVRWTHGSGDGVRADQHGWSTDYTLNGNGSIIDQLDKDQNGVTQVHAQLAYDGDRLSQVQTDVGSMQPFATTTQTYRYDDAGDVQRVYQTSSQPAPATNQTGLDPAACAKTDTDTAQTDSTTRYCYDEFNRQILAVGPDLKPQLNAYDGLDRRESSTTQDADTGAPVDTTTYSYIGASRLLTHQVTTSADGTTTKSRSFDYDSQGNRLGIGLSDASGSSYHPYATDGNGSVTGLENADGSFDGSTYRYDPYGQLDNTPDANQSDPQADPDAKQGLTGDAADNPFRFEGFYYDSHVQTYDMQARNYQPQHGQFLQRDTYASAAGDESLDADPLTQNRYAFAGDNPTTNVEYDGHEPNGSFHSKVGPAHNPYNRPVNWRPHPVSQQSTQSPDAYDAGHRGSVQRSIDRPTVDAYASVALQQVQQQRVTRWVHSVCLRGERCSDSARRHNAQLALTDWQQGRLINTAGWTFDTHEALDDDNSILNPVNLVVDVATGGTAVAVKSVGDWAANRLVQSAAKAEEEGGLIFRGGTQTENALTDKGTGLSFRDSLSNPVDQNLAVLRPGEKYFAVDTAKLPRGSWVRDNVPPGHVSVRGLTPDQIRRAIVDPNGNPFLGGKFPK